jgi:putative membrane protein
MNGIHPNGYIFYEKQLFIPEDWKGFIAWGASSRYTSCIMELIKLLGIGIILGIANVIPGVSGGTIAVVFNVYDGLIRIITPDIKKILAAWKFWLPLGMGIGAGIIFFSNVITFLFTHYPVPTNCFFIGIILGSLPMLYRKIQSPHTKRPPLSGIICGFAALAIMLVMKLLKPQEETPLYTVLTPVLFGVLFSAGALAAAAMIIPGISGSFLLLVTRMYRTIIQAVSDLHISLLLPVGLGVGLGLLAGAALVRFLMAKAPRQTYSAILGLVAGSILVIFPAEGLGSGSTLILSAVSLLLGGAVSFVSSPQ